MSSKMSSKTNLVKHSFDAGSNLHGMDRGTGAGVGAGAEVS